MIQFLTEHYVADALHVYHTYQAVIIIYHREEVTFGAGYDIDKLSKVHVRLDTQKSSNPENIGKMGLFTDTCKLAIACQIERIEEGVVKWHNAIKVSASRLPVGQH